MNKYKFGDINKEFEYVFKLVSYYICGDGDILIVGRMNTVQQIIDKLKPYFDYYKFKNEVNDTYTDYYIEDDDGNADTIRLINYDNYCDFMVDVMKKDHKCWIPDITVII